MSIIRNKEANRKIFDEYSALLEKKGIEYSNDQNGFYVHVPLKNIGKSFTLVCPVINGKVLLTDYCGDCYTGLKTSKTVEKALREKFPDYDIKLEHYAGGYEAVIYHEVKYTTPEELHAAVLEIARIADEGSLTGKEMLGKDFIR